MKNVNGTCISFQEEIMLFEAQLSPDNTEMKITIAGRFDFNLHSEFRNSYKNLPPTTKYIIDLEKTDYIDS